VAERAHPRRRLASFIGLLLLIAGMLPFAAPAVVLADSSTQSLPFTQAWTNTGLITTNDDWSGVPGVIGYLGQDITTVTGTDPQTLTGESALANDVDVIANQTNTAITNGGVAEFQIVDPVVALQGSGTADAPYLLFAFGTTGQANVNVAYNLRDIDATTDNSVQPVALQFRVGSSGAFTNVPAGYVADATSGPSLATLVTAVNVTLPAAADNKALVQVRVMTTNAVGNDEWVGVDDIAITASSDAAPSVLSSTPANGATGVALDATPSVTFSEPVALDETGVGLNCNNQGGKTVTASGGPVTWTLATDPFLAGDHCILAILASAVTDTDTTDPPDTMAANFSASFDTAGGTPPTTVVISEVYGGGGNAGAIFKNDFIELYNTTASPISLTGWSVQYAAAAGSTWQVTALTGSIPAHRNYLVQEAAGTGGTLGLPTPDATGSIAMAATAGKVALVSSTTALSGACPTVGIIDFVGYGTTASCFEGSGRAPAPSNTTSDQRVGGGATDTNDNAADFAVAAPDPHGTSDPAPTVGSSIPSTGASGVALASDITITFSEAVTTTGSWFTISCSLSGAHTATVTGGPVQFVLNPDADFSSSESCTVTVVAANVTDQDTDDPPDNMTADATITFTTIDAAVCGDPGVTFIHDIQGSGLSSPISGSIVSIEGTVVGDYQQTGGFNGYYVEEEAGDFDANTATSEGIFVFNTATPVNVGDHVRVKGTVTEFNLLTELTSISSVLLCSTGNPLPAPATISLPVASLNDWEPVEGMLVSLSQTLTVTEVFNLGRFGEVSLSGTGRLPNPTNVVAPGAPSIALEDLNDRSRIILDDGDNQQNIDPTIYPQGGLSASNTLRVGDSLPSLTGIGDQRFGNYRIQPTGPISFNHTNPRPAAPGAVGGNLRVASFNVLNFFNGDGLGGGFPTPRGANTLTEFNRQLAKEVSAITALDADIVGLMELENDAPGHSAIEDLVAALNAATAPGTYAFIDTGIIGTDQIRVGLLYQPAAVTPIGAFETITTAVDPRFIDTKNRPSLAQTFESNLTGGRLTVVVNHLKSKGSDCNDVGDPDTGDGQGNCNLTRKHAAEAIVDWLATDPTGAGDADYLLIGDMNSYAMEDPISTFKANGFEDTISTHIGAGAYSYVFDGESGYLDHALASTSLAAQVTGVAEWHINPDEPTVLDYNTEFKTANQINTFYDPGPYRSSDHDPVLVGIDLNTGPSVDAGGPYAVNSGSSVLVSATGNDPDGQPLTYAWDLDDNGSFETAGQTVSFDASAIAGPATFTIHVQVTDAGGATATDDATVTVNALPTVDAGGPYAVNSGSSVSVSATGNDPEGGALAYAWDLDDNGSFETAGQTVSFDASAIAGPATYTIHVQVTDAGGATATADATVTVNAHPTVDAGGPYTVNEGSSVTVTATGNDPEGGTLTYAWDLDDNGSFETAGASATFNAPAGSAPSSPTIRVRVTDPDGLTATATTTVRITWVFTGFLSPLSNPPVENSAKAGSGLPIKFMLGGNQGLAVIAAGYPRSISYTCGIPLGSRPTDATTPTASTGFTYDAATGIYNYSWKTDKGWMNTCRRFVLKLTDGSYHYVDVHFTK